MEIITRDNDDLTYIDYTSGSQGFGDQITTTETLQCKNGNYELVSSEETSVPYFNIDGATPRGDIDLGAWFEQWNIDIDEFGCVDGYLCP